MGKSALNKYTQVKVLHPIFPGTFQKMLVKLGYKVILLQNIYLYAEVHKVVLNRTVQYSTVWIN